MQNYEFLQKHIVYEFLNGQTTLNLTPLVVGFERCKNTKGSIGPLKRDRYILQYVIEGQGTLTLNGKTFRVKKNNIMLLPMETIVYAPDPEDPWVYLWIEFSGLAASGLLEKAGLTADTPIQTPDDPEAVFELFAEMIDGLQKYKQREFYPLFCTANLLKILYLLLAQRGKNDGVLPSETNRIIPVIHYIEEHYSDPDISVKKICELFFWSPSYLTRVFKKVMDISPIKYINQLRIRKATAMLASKQFKIFTIAYACGYSSPYYFSLEFKRAVGVAPSQYVARLTE